MASLLEISEAMRAQEVPKCFVYVAKKGELPGLGGMLCFLNIYSEDWEFFGHILLGWIFRNWKGQTQDSEISGKIPVLGFPNLKMVHVVILVLTKKKGWDLHQALEV